LVVFDLTAFAGLTFVAFALAVCNLAGLCCVSMTYSDFVISESNISDDE
jgi:hypothetical protein